MIWGGRYIKFIVGLNPTRLDSSVARASGICPEAVWLLFCILTKEASSCEDFQLNLVVPWGTVLI